MNQKFPGKIHIIGSIGSGKTTLARKLSAQLQVFYYELDNVVWKRSNTGDIKRTPEERDEYLKNIVNSDSWIIEGVHHKWVASSFQNADVILFIDTKLSIRKFRIIKRFIRQKLGLETANYKPTLKILKDLYKYNTAFEYHTKPEILNMLRPYEHKLIYVKSDIEIINYFKNS
ncbi:AAA family ATPase [Oceanobacillus sojae]|uniref:DNA topology modulation protein FlaR n=1 Tax=Oceanobacillus sojae TaxID=582851 RepID=A0A511ZEV8_9BACI|nr:AAA family ATPase [Oceanobacillus sojae]GEN85985.1 DNA topology modulation protein FlaR [Oceanobacillus sojae]